MISYFLLERVIAWRRFISLKLSKQFVDFLYGTTIGIFTTLTQVIIDQTYDEYVINLFIISSITIMILRNFSTSLYMIIGPLIYFAINDNWGDAEYVSLFGFFLLLMFVNIIQNYTSKSKTIFITIIASLLVSLLTWLTNTIIFNNDFSEELFATDSLVFIILIGFLTGSLILYNFALSSRLIYESSNFVHNNFTRVSLASNTIQRYIIDNKPSKAMFLLFKIKINIIDEAEKEIILENYLNLISKSMPKDLIIFEGYDDTFGIFSKPSNSLIIQKILDRLPKKAVLSSEREIEISIDYGFATYGKDSSNIDELWQHADFALYSNKHEFDPIKYLKAIKEEDTLNNLDAFVSLDQFKHESTLLTGEYDLQLFSITNENSKENKYDDLLIYNGWNNLFYRYFAADILKANIERKIVIPYDISIFNESFSIESFINSVERYSSTDNIHLLVKNSFIGLVEDHKTTQKIIKELTIKGIKFILDKDVDKALWRSLYAKEYAKIITTEELQTYRYNRFNKAIYIGQKNEEIEKLIITKKINFIHLQ